MLDKPAASMYLKVTKRSFVVVNGRVKKGRRYMV